MLNITVFENFPFAKAAFAILRLAKCLFNVLCPVNITVEMK